MRMPATAIALAFLTAAPATAAELNLYSSRHYDTDLALYENFTAQTGITVNLIEGEADQLMERILSEGANSPADLLITVDGGRLHRAVEAGIFAPVDSAVLEERVPAKYQHPDNLWFGLTTRARVIYYDKSRGVFHGRILVQPGAQKTDAKQTNKNLLLSDDATANTKPQLEIYADDVKCTHGATIGQLNEESIFYLRTRGIGPETARRMLIHAFAGEITERIQYEPAREELDKLVWDRLEANPHLAEKK